MKTPMQELFEEIEEYQAKNKHIPKSVKDQFIEKEKQVIINAYKRGNTDHLVVDYPSAKYYYKKTFVEAPIEKEVDDLPKSLCPKCGKWCTGRSCHDCQQYW
ncbi:MAG: hypothetical protein ACTSUK_10870 [Promethearchaeota archaeon]